MTTNRFGASPVITGNFVSLAVVAVAPNDGVWPNTVNTPITLTDDSPDQFLIDVDVTATVVNLPAPSAQNEGKNFFIKIAAGAVGLTVQAPAFGTTGPLVPIRVLDDALDFIQLECQDQTPVGGPIAYGWATVLCLDNGAWVA